MTADAPERWPSVNTPRISDFSHRRIWTDIFPFSPRDSGDLGATCNTGAPADFGVPGTLAHADQVRPQGSDLWANRSR